MRLDLFKQDGSGELGLSRILLQEGQTTPTFWALSDEGDLVLIDWSIKPIQTSDDAPKIAEYVRMTYDSEKEYRPGLALERSPFYPNLLLTVHNFLNDAVPKDSLERFFLVPAADDVDRLICLSKHRLAVFDSGIHLWPLLELIFRLN